MCVVVGVDAGVLVCDVYGVVYLLRHLVLGVYVGMSGVKYLCVGTGDAEREAGWLAHRRDDTIGKIGKIGAGCHTPGAVCPSGTRSRRVVRQG